ncbi:MAG: DUF3300 domain-containing protein [Rhodobacteraceae bacterium]|nr:DUF3300 domain-containing protein [Paracoccaceae bacterium]
MQFSKFLVVTILSCIFATGSPVAQTSDTLVETELGINEEALLSSAELEDLVAPIALYPDTLLIQVLVAATVPFEVLQADIFITTYESDDPEFWQQEIEDQGWDPSVTVLATGFPTVLSRMADDIEWTEAVGLAMLAQDDDIMSAIQRLRDQAINSGALLSNDKLTVSSKDDVVVITPTEPNVIYVPSYDPVVVYRRPANDVFVKSAIILSTAILIDNIFDKRHRWNGYWGCRNCAGWGGRPIHARPNAIYKNNGDVIINKNNNNSVWKPTKGQNKVARKKILKRKARAAKAKNKAQKASVNKRTKIKKPKAINAKTRNSNTGNLRKKLSTQTGSRDISKKKKKSGNAQQPSNSKKTKIKKPAQGQGQATGRAQQQLKKKKAVKRAQPQKKKAVKRAQPQKKKAVKRAQPQKKPKKSRNIDCSKKKNKNKPQCQ